jgi:hypothetical protein
MKRTKIVLQGDFLGTHVEENVGGCDSKHHVIDGQGAGVGHEPQVL